MHPHPDNSQLPSKTNTTMLGTTKSDFSAAFEEFLITEEVRETVSAFTRFTALLPESSEYSYTKLKAFAQPLLSYKRQALFKLLDCKILASSKAANESSQGKEMVVSGAGPVGLRAAVEAVLAGFRVTVLELRGEFSRHNVIKTWNHTITDLISLGLGHYYPQFSAHGNSSLHLGIKEIQTCLLKAALLLGVKIQYETGVCGVVDPAAEIQTIEAESETSNDTGLKQKFSVWTLPAAEARLRLKRRAEMDGIDTSAAEKGQEVALRPGEQDLTRVHRRNRVDFFEPASSEDGAVIRSFANARSLESGAAPSESEEMQHQADVAMLRNASESGANLVPFDYLIVAEGESSRLIRHLGFSRKIWKFANMIGIVVNLDITPSALKSMSSSERSLPEFVVSRMAATWRQGPLGKLDALGFELENMEYLRSMKTHFFVCTIKKTSVLSSGIVKEEKDTIKDLLEYDNLNLDKLRAFARELGNIAGVPASCPLSAKHGVQIFDFSCKGQCIDTMRKLVSTNPAAAAIEAVVLPAGDALQNPYWPQGLGVNRGIHSALDAVHAATIHAQQGFEAALYERYTAFRVMEWYTLEEGCLITPTPSLGGVKAATGNSKEHEWTMDPTTRYSRGLFRSIHMADASLGAANPSLPQRVRKALALEWGTYIPGPDNQTDTSAKKPIRDENYGFPEDDMSAAMARITHELEVMTTGKPVKAHEIPSQNTFDNI
ncbi:hypothetical protein BJ741DRAFT_6643 [Chytriomyces cf. hyalinus JEL632]|nr:hypothetical protein BJ741DRAFT_6643 [Chytriomyces cf. hyalinus JEL632]